MDLTSEDEDEPKVYDGYPPLAVCNDCDSPFEIGETVATRPMMDTVSLIEMDAAVVICVPCRTKLEAAAL